MKLDDYKQAQRLMERIEEFDKMDVALRSAAQDVKKQHNESDAEDLAQLIIKLAETKEGERVIDHIVGTITWKFEEAKRELREMFNDL